MIALLLEILKKFGVLLHLRLALFVLLFPLPTTIVLGQSNLIFKHLTAEDGLSISSVISIAQDSTGFMWFGAKYALNRYDGQSIKVYKNNLKEKPNIWFNDYIRVIVTDRTNHLWLGSNNGLNCYNPTTDEFSNILPNVNVFNLLLDDANNIWAATEKGLVFFEKGSRSNQKNIIIKIAANIINSTNNINTIYKDSKGKLWIGTRLNGLLKGMVVGDTFIAEKVYNTSNQSLEDNYIGCITEDNEHQIWVGTRASGLSIINTKTEKITQLAHNNNDPNSLTNNNIRKIKVARDGNVWVATQNGLSIIVAKKLTITNYRSDPNSNNSLSQNSLYDIVEDRQGCMWVATYFGGVNIIYANTTPFKVYKHTKENNSISSNIISEFKEDAQHNLWIGTEASGFNYFNRKTNSFTHYENKVGDKNSLSSNLVKSIFIDKQENIWVGTSLGGLNVYNPKTNNFNCFRNQHGDTNSLNFDEVKCMLEDSKGRFWVGAMKGLDTLDRDKKELYRIKVQIKNAQLLNDYVYTIFEDREKNIWIGIENGILLLENDAKEFIIFNNDNVKNLIFSHINCIQQDKKGRIWMGIYHGGLCLFDRKSLTFKTYKQEDGLCSDNVVGILEDDNGYLWISTDKGLCKCKPEENFYRTYNSHDGLPSNEFNTSSYYKTNSGEMFFGGFNGFVSFFPKDITDNILQPKVVITELKLFNNLVSTNGNDGILKKNISYTDTIYFNHNQNIFSIGFSCLNFIKPTKNNYAYKLEGFEQRWNYVTTPTATYTNLSPGTYTLLVKASNNDKVWNDVPTKLTIVILPPPWRTWWAYLLYAIAFGIANYVVIHYIRARSKLKRELYYEHLLNERQEYVHQMKLEFFTNISHELRTPLTLIKGQIDMLLETFREEGKANKLLLNIKQNSDRLIRLVSELMDFRKAEAGHLALHFSANNVAHFVQEIFLSFSAMAEKRGIDYRFEHPEKEMVAYFDKIQMEKVVFNILSNAFKYVPDNGYIKVKIEQSSPQAIDISITDNGKGISQENLNKVFENFFQVENNQNHLGTGIGLAFSKSIVEMHKGTITVNSTQATAHAHGQTCFKVSLLTGTAHLDKDAIISEISPNESIEGYTTNLEKPTFEGVNPSESVQEVKQKNTLLIVEDNAEIRDLLRESFSNTYKVIEAENGSEGLTIALEEIPDLIISDVMMPIMNGMELCKKLKADERTNHIPVILLTARTAYIHQMNGLEMGADDYITKPFDMKLLAIKVSNLLYARDIIRKKYAKKITLEPTFTDNTPDDPFLENMGKLIEDNISDTEFGVDQLAKMLYMSRSVLYKKVAALTDMTVADFIKTYRLKKAAFLLKQNKLSVTEVAFEIGFGNRKYFSKEFKKHFGISPSAFTNNEEEEDREEEEPS